MTTPPGQEPRPGASRGGTARPRRGAGPGWSPTGGDGPRFTPSRGDGGPPRASGRSQDGRGHDERGGGGRGGSDPGYRDRTDSRDSPRRPADRGGARRGVDRGGSAQASGRDELRAGPAVRWVGTLRPRRALTIFFGIAVLGAVATVVTKKEPGALLGNLIVLGAVIAALGIERRAMYLVIPLPALTYLVLALLTGAIHDSGADTSTAQLGLNFLQWIGNGFFSLCAATILVLVIFGGRLLTSRQLVSGSFPMSAQRSSSGRPDRPPLSAGAHPDPRRDERRRPGRAPWDDPDPWYDQDPRDRRAQPDHRDRRDGRGDRDGWNGGGNARQGRRPGGRDSWDDRGYRSGGPPRAGRDSWDHRNPRGR